MLNDGKKGRAAALHENVPIIGTGRLLLAARKSVFIATFWILDRKHREGTYASHHTDVQLVGR